MTPERWKQIKAVFQAAADLGTGQRTAFLDQACAGQPELRAAVEALLAAHEASGNPLDQPPAATGAYDPSEGDEVPPPIPQPRTTDYQPATDPGAVIAGRYTLMEKIGERAEARSSPT